MRWEPARLTILNINSLKVLALWEQGATMAIEGLTNEKGVDSLRFLLSGSAVVSGTIRAEMIAKSQKYMHYALE